MFALLLLATGADPAPRFAVENKTAPAFVVVNKTVPACPCKPHAPGTPWPDPHNCGSFLCPSNGGPGGCPCTAPVGKSIHVSPDGTVNELHADGIFRPVGARPVQVSPVPTAPVPHTLFAAPVFGSCAGGSCGAPARAPARGAPRWFAFPRK